MSIYNNEFEYAPGGPWGRRAHAYVTYSREAVMRYRAESAEEIVDDPGILLKMIKHHKAHQVPRLELLESYYLGNNPQIMTGKRRIEKNKSDHRLRHSFAAIISDFLNSYVIGNPVKISPTDTTKDYPDLMRIIDEFNAANDIDAHNIEIGKDQNNLGRAFELIQQNQNDETKLYRLDPREVFMIYDNTVATKVIAACRYFPLNPLDDIRREYIVNLYTKENVYTYRCQNIETAESLRQDGDPEPHQFYGVPIIEYRSDRYRMSVYEKQLSLIDAYDAAQSDTANYMTDFNDAILVLEGKIKNAEDTEYMRKMKDANILVLVPADEYSGDRTPLKASYLTKSYDVAGVEAYKSRIKEDIYNLSSVPNLSDEAFSGNKSGEALKYKMFGLQQKRNDKEKFLAKGFRVRYKLLENINRAISELSGDTVDLDFKFTPNIPRAYLEELTAFVKAGGRISQETSLELLSFIDDPQAELERIEGEENMTPAAGNPFFDTFGLPTTHEAPQEPLKE